MTCPAQPQAPQGARRSVAGRAWPGRKPRPRAGAGAGGACVQRRDQARQARADDCGGRTDRSARARSSLGFARRDQAGPCARTLRPDPGGGDRDGHRQFDRRLHRCPAEHGAVRVFAVDSGTNQLAWKLRQDPRVTVLEKTSARVLTPALIDAPCGWVVCDASFIGLAKVLEVPLRLAAPRVSAGRADQAAVRSRAQRSRQRRRGARSGAAPASLRRGAGLAGRRGWAVQGIVESPIKGPEGNVEFLIAAERG